MPTVHFLGDVLPGSANISIPHDISVSWEDREIDLRMVFRPRIIESSIDILCEVSRWDQGVVTPIYMRALDLCRASVDVVGFAMGWGLTVHLHTLVDPMGNASSLFFNDPRIPKICTAYSLATDFGEVLKMVMEEPTLFMAFNDLIAAISVPHASLVNCARAMDRIKHLLSSPGTTDREAWAAMRSVLRIDEAYLKYITDASAGPRHGRPGHISGEITREVTVRAWAVMNRYLEYRRAGNSLPATLSFLAATSGSLQP